MKKKVVAAIMSVALVAAVGIGGTLAYLSATSDTVDNTFTVGKGYIDDGKHTGLYLDEVVVNEDGQATSNRTEEGQEYGNMYPGDKRVKDPTVHFIAGSVESYVFVKVDGVGKADGNWLQVNDWNTSNWQKVADLEGDAFGTTGDGYYMYVGQYADANHVVDFSDEVEAGTYGKEDAVSLGAIFNEIELENIGNDEFEKIQPNLNGTKISITACAVQAGEGTTWEDGFAEAVFK